MKNILLNLLANIQRLVQRWLIRLKTPVSVETIVINSLAPRVLTDAKEIERVKPYLDSLKSAILANGINNIAITGGYGSGKSTILKTFQDIYEEFKYLNISLASFTDNKEDKENFERKLEVSILQQMFYHVKPSEIPDSRFKRIINLTNRNLFIRAFLLVVWLFSSLILIKFDYISKLNPSTWSIEYDMDVVAVISALIFFAGVGFFIKSIYRLFSNSRINKVNIKGELELAQAADKSVFNQHLEEILYFFERTTYNVVVIEDVDRFDSTDIFTKLREINILLNSSKSINRQVKFVYAIKDEMFKDKNERVKFFEFIIPIIPFINPSNASDQLEKLITEANLQGQLSPDFTSDIVTFIDDIDMRLLINIFHEYQIYRRLLSSSLNQDKLFAILVYKNMYPGDFGELSKRKGNLYKFFTSKVEYLFELTNDIKAKIREIDIRISASEKSIPSSVEELRAVYITHLVSRLSNFNAFSFGQQPVTLAQVVKDEYFEHLLTNQNFYYIRYGANYNGLVHQTTQANIVLSDVEKEVYPDLTYLQREKALRDRLTGEIDALKKERELLVSELSEWKFRVK